MIDKGTINNALTRGNKSEIIGWCMPSNTWIDISSHTWGEWYQAPASGYVFIQRSGLGNLGITVSSTPNDEDIVYMNCNVDGYDGGSLGKAVAAPVRKGQYYKFFGSAQSTIHFARFVYAEGEI